ncbi:MAG: nucleoside-diphosphate sugar epimerase/dehydratase [Thermodesulfobacteriota bacterium]|nr:nucleoside-diphosphate sugar epimerase/dehydratase [Thermodesulfobacteriota bacterium]
MPHILKNRNFWIMLLVDALLLATSYYAAYYLRFDGSIPANFFASWMHTVAWIVPLKLACFMVFGMYSGMWRYTSVQDLENLAKACLASSAMIVLALLITVRFHGFPRSVFVMDILLTFFLVGGLRLGIRLYFHRKDTSSRIPFLRSHHDHARRLLIIGAGDAGEKTLRELRDNPRLSYRVVGFIDDDPKKMGRAIHHLPVLGNVESLPQVAEKYRADEVLIAVPSATGKQMRRIVEACEASGLPYKTLPGMGELINGHVSIKALRDVDYRDLLGRPPVHLHFEQIQGYLKGRRVLVSGAGGSIGSELCRQIARFHPERLVLLDASEPNLYDIHMELEQSCRDLPCSAVLGGIQNEPVLESTFRRYKPQVVFHAAAYKHVPMLERNPWQAVNNNIRASRMIMEHSIRHKVEDFVLVSTDKAVRPTNVMGASKRVCELVLQSFRANGTRMRAVRFGNVMGSSGSVIPHFRQQIARGGPVTVTHPEVRRYFMTVPESCQLILQAGALGNGGEIFVLEMGTPVKIVDMARDLIRLSGKDPDRDVEIVFTGLRPGEKLNEELITEDEGIAPTPHEKILVLKPNGGWNGHGNREGFCRWLYQGVDDLYRLAGSQDAPGIKEKLNELVPEYRPQETECVL